MNTKRCITWKGSVFSDAPLSHQFSGPYESFEMNQRFRDEEIYQPLDNHNEFLPSYLMSDRFQIGPLFLPQQKKVYGYDAMETWGRELYLKMIAEAKTNLPFVKKAIVDDRIPPFLEIWSTPEKYIDLNEGEMETNPNLLFESGRNVLVKMIGECRYDNALPELREIIFHDDSNIMKRRAILALRTLTKHKVVPTVEDVFKNAHEHYEVVEISRMIRDHFPMESFVPLYREKLEEFFLFYSESYLARKYFNTPQQSLVLDVAEIPSILSLEIIERGIVNPYPHVRSAAHLALVHWVRNCTKIVLRKKTSVNEKLLKKVREVIMSYGLDQYRDVWYNLGKSIPKAYREIAYYWEDSF